MKKLVKNKLLIIILIIVTLFSSLWLYIAIEKGNFYKYNYKIQQLSQKYGVDSNLVLAICRTESNFNKDAVSIKGAVGIMQIMPSTCKYLAELNNIPVKDLTSADYNLEIGIIYLKYLLDKFTLEYLAILSYNAGETVVLSWINSGVKLPENIPYKETKNYYKKVIRRKRLYS